MALSPVETRPGAVRALLLARPWPCPTDSGSRGRSGSKHAGERKPTLLARGRECVDAPMCLSFHDHDACQALLPSDEHADPRNSRGFRLSARARRLLQQFLKTQLRLVVKVVLVEATVPQPLRPVGYRRGEPTAGGAGRVVRAISCQGPTRSRDRSLRSLRSPPERHPRRARGRGARPASGKASGPPRRTGQRAATARDDRYLPPSAL